LLLGLKALIIFSNKFQDIFNLLTKLGFTSVFKWFFGLFMYATGHLHPIFGNFWQGLYQEAIYFSYQMPCTANALLRVGYLTKWVCWSDNKVDMGDLGRNGI